MKKQLQIDRIISTLIFALIFCFVFLKTLSLWGTEIKYKSIDSCGKTGSVSYKTPDGATINEPSKDWYERCLKDKGIK